MCVSYYGSLYCSVISFSSGTDRIGIFVLDEADEMLSRGFKDQIYDVFRLLPNDVQVCYCYTVTSTSRDLAIQISDASQHLVVNYSRCYVVVLRRTGIAQYSEYATEYRCLHIR